ncbi:hypothetical protein GC088_12685 [Arthrobacter sp. JZ12]|uniref:hypothetical protein n=1 Tax=Arthrobacter sp. JZ12 TaxID=2654190 RepID=UPI002B48A77D|nr:hypothetical protein [Arthrobacter sp. JZ12]WRH25843.1 hypothetical protein GC088_12685 [Arthrobacter sp. JZ12]
MRLEDFVEEARLWNRDPAPQSDALVKKLRSLAPETIIDLYQQALQRASDVYEEWNARPEPRALFTAKHVDDQGSSPQDPFPGAPPLLGRFPKSVPSDYEQWIRGWCLYQVLAGNTPVPDDQFEPRTGWPDVMEYFTGMIGIKSFHHDFQSAYERSTDTLWPLSPREEDREFLIYGEQREHAPYPVQLYRATAREVTMDLNESATWRRWWLSGPLRSLEFGIAETYALYPGATAMHTSATPTSTRMRKLGLTVTTTVIPNLDRILEAGEADVRQLVITDLDVMFHKVHNKYGFTVELPKAE